jgi:hypothetical protein
VADTSADMMRIPKGHEFLSLLWEQEDACENETDKILPTCGKRAPACMAQIGTVLTYVDRMASCWWGCQQDDHIVEYLCGRVASSARACLRLTRFGFYDEALMLCRSTGEIANLLHLFSLDRATLEEWKSLSRAARLQRFGPFKVRVQIEQRGEQPRIDQERYRLLSERVAHVNPGTKPQSHNPLGIPIAGAMLQREGLLVCINELALSLTLATLFGALLLNLQTDTRREIAASAKCLAEQIGGATILDVESYHQSLFNDAGSRAELERIAAELRSLQVERRSRGGPGED